MSTLQHINSVIDYNWPEYQRRFPAVNKPQIVPAETLRGMAPTYLHSAIDQDPTSMYMFIACDPTKGDCSRKTACEFFDDLFTNKLRMPSSYEANEGYSHEEAIDKEVLPAENNSQFRSYYDEQMARMEAQRREEERQRRINDLGFDPDDPDIIDAEVIEPDGSTSGGSQQRSTAVGQAQSTAVGQARKIFYCIDFHVNAGAMLGYNGNNNRLGGRRRPGGYLRESKNNNIIDKLLYVYKRIIKDNSNIESVATPEIESSSWELFLIKYKDGLYGRFYINKEQNKYGNPNIVELYKQKKETKQEIQNDLNYYQKRGINFIVFTKDELDQLVAAENSSVNESDPEKMMKEFVEKKENGEVKLSQRDINIGAKLVDMFKSMSATQCKNNGVYSISNKTLVGVEPNKYENGVLYLCAVPSISINHFIHRLKDIGVTKLSDVHTIIIEVADDDYNANDIISIKNGIQICYNTRSTSDMDEDDMLKNRPHNLHKDEKLLESDDLEEDDDILEDDDLEECDDLTEDTAETEELEEDDEVAEKDEFELNESLINFSTRLIRG